LNGNQTLSPCGVDHWQNLPEVARLPYQGQLMHRGRSRPLYLRIETVNTCNNLCVVCAYRDQERPKTMMAKDVFEKTVRDYVELGGGYLSLTPLVGDTLLDRYLVDRLKYLETIPQIRELGITTNAAMAHRFNDEELRYIVSRFTKLSISVYGVDADEYERMTGRKTYLRMKDGVRRILTLSPFQVQLEFRLLNKRTKEELVEWVRTEILSEAQAAEFSSKIYINSVITDYANWGVYDAINTPLPADARWFSSERQEQREQCLIPLFACIVFSNGNVSFCPCDNFNDVPELRLGNIVNDSLANMYSSKRAQDLWNWAACGTPEFCKNCSFHIPLDLIKANSTILNDPHQIVGAG
jgi:MoaA/NifB/PqqE/SkfB family radical SAM enzyme